MPHDPSTPPSHPPSGSGLVPPGQSIDRPQFFLLTTEGPCPYLPDRTERKLITELHGPKAGSQHGRLSRAGFRRSHRFAYRPACRGCDACVAVRIAADRFTPSRSQQRILRRNRDLSVHIAPAQATPEQYRLFELYLLSRHSDGEMAGMSAEDYRAMVEDSAVASSLVSFRDSQGVLVAVCLVDWLDDGASAVYSFFEPAQHRRSLGSHCILWLVEACRERNLPYLYLGYWIAGAPKMDYKARFDALEGLTPRGWERFDTPG
ncbi:arginyltransferase [Aquibaculum sediminis]|uniref:arginyltransferase n=1 Tax=Aquibaculum sediminis TaxID=3231907 RepID=UPI0034550A61